MNDGLNDISSKYVRAVLVSGCTVCAGTDAT